MLKGDQVHAGRHQVLMQGRSARTVPRERAISRLAEQGVDARVIQRIVGHSSLSMTERYAHVGDESLRRAVEKLALGKPDLHAVKDSGPG